MNTLKDFKIVYTTRGGNLATDFIKAFSLQQAKVKANERYFSQFGNASHFPEVEEVQL